MSEPTMSYLIREWADEDVNDGEWPYPTEYSEYVITGELADRIRARFEQAATDGVTIVETRVSGGYSEWTQETDYSFTVKCGRLEREFDTGWSYSSTAVARLQEWLERS